LTGFTKKAREVRFIGTSQNAIGNVRHARILKHHQAGQIVLKMAEFTLIVEQIAECFGMESHYRSRGHDGQDHYPPSYPGAIEIGKSDPILYHSGAEGKSQHFRALLHEKPELIKALEIV